MKNNQLNIYHRPDLDFVSIDFKDEIEARSYFDSGVIVREDKSGNVIGIDITDSSQFFSNDDTMNLKEVCQFLNISESTLRRRIREGKIPYTKPNGKDYQFEKKNILKLKKSI